MYCKAVFFNGWFHFCDCLTSNCEQSLIQNSLHILHLWCSIIMSEWSILLAHINQPSAWMRPISSNWFQLSLHWFPINSFNTQKQYMNVYIYFYAANNSSLPQNDFMQQETGSDCVLIHGLFQLAQCTLPDSCLDILGYYWFLHLPWRCKIWSISEQIVVM